MVNKVNKKIKRFIPATVAVALTSIVVFNSLTGALAATDQERLRDLQSQQNEAQSEGNALDRQEREELDRIDAIEEEILNTEDALHLIRTQLNVTEEMLETATTDLEEAQELRQDQQEMLVNRARAMHMNGPITYIDAMLSATSFSDLLMRLEFVGRVIEHDNNLVAELLDTETRIEDNVETIYLEQQRMSALELQYNTRLEEHERNLSERTAAMSNITDAQRENQNLQLELDREIRQVERDIRAREFTARATAGASTNRQVVVPTGNGVMTWPVPGRSTISSPFGPRRSPITGRQEQHTGIDIPAPTGSDLVAAQDGIVIFSGWMNGYGNTVRIDHGENVVTLYGHNSSNLVSAGESVVAGQLIGRIGSTGFSTGAHSHFEVRYQGTAVNPMNFLN